MSAKELYALFASAATITRGWISHDQVATIQLSTKSLLRQTKRPLLRHFHLDASSTAAPTFPIDLGDSYISVSPSGNNQIVLRTSKPDSKRFIEVNSMYNGKNYKAVRFKWEYK